MSGDDKSNRKTHFGKDKIPLETGAPQPYTSGKPEDEDNKIDTKENFKLMGVIAAAAFALVALIPQCGSEKSKQTPVTQSEEQKPSSENRPKPEP
jgi:hypothetical protein